MKKILVVMVVVVVALMSATAAMATIAGSKHDFSSAGSASTGYANGTMSSCQYCHTPHHAANSSAPLWNRDNSTATYVLYSSGSTSHTLSGTLVGNPGPNSQTCLSCHDGTIGVGTILNNNTVDTITGAALTGGRVSSAAGLIGVDLTRTHPVGIIYNSGASRAGLTVGVANTIAGRWQIYGGTGDGTSTVECGSCHDPHSTTNSPFLKAAIGTMCSDCHSLK